ncbi:MAG: tetratricopeptide repeat protein [Desulfuromonas sp.]
MPMNKTSQTLAESMVEAIKCHQSGDLDRAESEYRAILHQKPDTRSALINLGVILRQKKQFAEAEHCYAQALKNNPDDLDALGNCGNLFMVQDRLVEAEGYFRRILNISPRNAPTLYTLATVLRLAGKLESEIKNLYKQAWNLDPEGIGQVAAVYLSVMHYLNDEHWESQYWLPRASGLLEKDPIALKGPRNYFKLMKQLLDTTNCRKVATPKNYGTGTLFSHHHWVELSLELLHLV